MIKIFDFLHKYKKVFLSTNPLYFAYYLYHSFRKKEPKKRIKKYSEVPTCLNINYLRVNSNIQECQENTNAIMNILSLAEDICKGKYYIFSTQINKILGEWNKDPLTGYMWPLVYFNEVRKLTPQGSVVKENNDIKYPWELSNMHMLVTLAQAYVLSGKMKYKECFFELLEDWKNSCPVGYGVNWSCTMDVAVRSINIIVAASLLNQYDDTFDAEFKRFYPLLYSHMLFISDNIEYGFVRENHYLSDIVGLKIIAQVFCDDKTASRCYKFARKRFKKEILYQIYPDGFNHEASSCYHVLVFELFLVGLVFDPDLLSILSINHRNRLLSMANALEKLCIFKTFPVVGDNDSGRVLKLNVNGVDYYRSLILLCKDLLFGGHENLYSSWLKDCSTGQGPHTASKVKYSLKTSAVSEYRHGGFAIIEKGRIILLFRAGTIGRKGKGGHSHNDQLSFVLDMGGESLLIDPGSFVYERDLEQRHLFRSTSVHNTVSIKGYEQNTISATKPFNMENETFAGYQIDENADHIQIIGTHRGYIHKCGLLHTRTICVYDSHLTVVDKLTGKYTGQYEIFFTLAPGITIQDHGGRLVLSSKAKDIVHVEIPASYKFKIMACEYSPSYGLKQKTMGISVEGEKGGFEDVENSIKFSCCGLS